MKFMALFQDVPESHEELQKVLGKKNLGATAYAVRRIPVYYGNDDSFAYNALALCFEGSLPSYLMNKLQAKMNNCVLIKGFVSET